jgi:hypothetical protein
LMMSILPTSPPEVNGFASCPIMLAAVAAIRTFKKRIESPLRNQSRERRKKEKTTAETSHRARTLLCTSSAKSSGPRWREDAAVSARRQRGGPCLGGDQEEEEGEVAAEGWRGGRLAKEVDWAMAIGFREGTATATAGCCRRPALLLLCSLLPLCFILV